MWDHLYLRDFHGCCGGNILTTFPVLMTSEPWYNANERAHIEKTNAMYTKAVHDQLAAIKRDEWAGAFICVALTTAQVQCWDKDLIEAGFRCVSSSVNDKTYSPIFFYIKERTQGVDFETGKVYQPYLPYESVKP